jgi:hypothetical protein
MSRRLGKFLTGGRTSGGELRYNWLLGEKGLGLYIQYYEAKVY